jgi:probable F420-dependent oxidoreductase
MGEGKRAFRFGVQNTGSSLAEWQEFARKAEDMGFSTIVVQDHFGPQLAPLPALLAAAAVTQTIRLGTLVLDNDFRHPAAMAKEAASVDVLSGGRLELGLGAGWMMPDYQKTGISFEPPAQRLSRFKETVAITKAFFTQDSVTFNGRHYQISGLDASPKVTQTPHPPLLVGGRQKGMLSFAAREADIVSISMLDRRTPDGPPPPSFAEKVGWVREAAGERFKDIELHANASNFEVTDNAQASLERIASRAQVPVEDLSKSPANLIGSVESIVEQVQAWREECGLTYFVVQSRIMESVAPVLARLL